MHRFLFAGFVGALVAGALFVSAPPLVEAGDYEALSATGYPIDVAHSAVEFEIGFMGLSKVRGRFADFSGTLVMNPSDPTTLSATVLIDAESIDTDNDFRDRHLRSPDFFEVQTYPRITFQSRRVAKAGDGYVMHGPLTIHGVTQEVQIPFEMTHGERLDAWGNRRVGFLGRLTIEWREFGLPGNDFWNQTLDLERLAIADRVEITLNVQGRISNLDRWNFRGEEGKPSVGEVLLPVAEERGAAAALARLRELEETPDAYTIDEGQLTLLGYKLLQHGKTDDAIAILELVKERYPESANAYDSLGEAYAAKGEKEKAIAHYEEALRRNPDSTSAIELLRWLRGEQTKVTLKA